MKAISYPMPSQEIVVAPRPRRRSGQKSTNPSVNALSYSGPYVKPQSKQGQETEVYQINFAATLQSSGTGTLTTVFNPGTQVTSSPDWSSISALWEEYRILSWKFETKPWNRFNGPTTNVLPPIYSVIDRNTATALASQADAIGYASCELHAVTDDIHRSAKMTGQDESQWVSTGSSPGSTAQAYLKLWGSGISNSINLMDYKMVYLVQVKGRK